MEFIVSIVTFILTVFLMVFALMQLREKQSHIFNFIVEPWKIIYKALVDLLTNGK